MDNGLGVGYGLVSALGFGATAIFARVGMRHVRPTTGTAVSLIIGAMVTMAIALSLHAAEIVALGAAAFGFILLNATLSYPVGRLFNFIGVHFAGASRASIIIGASPLFSAVLAVWLLDEEINATILVGTVLIIVGIGVVLSSRAASNPSRRSIPKAKSVRAKKPMERTQ